MAPIFRPGPDDASLRGVVRAGPAPPWMAAEFRDKSGRFF